MKLIELFETFESPYKFKWTDKESFKWSGYFRSDAGEVVVDMELLNEYQDQWNIVFHTSGSTGVTARGDAFKIFSTVIPMIIEFIEEVKPAEVEFDAAKPVPWKTKSSRSTLYAKMLKRFIGDEYSVAVDTGMKSDKFLLKRKQKEQ